MGQVPELVHTVTQSACGQATLGLRILADGPQTAYARFPSFRLVLQTLPLKVLGIVLCWHPSG